MKVKLYNLERMTRWELFQFVSSTLSFADEHLEGMPQSYTNKLEELRTLFDIYDEELVQERIPTPHQLMQAEDDCNYILRKIYQIICCYSDYRFDVKKEQAAKSLKNIFKSFGTGSRISRHAQGVKTAMIINLMQELSTDKARECIVSIGLTDAVLALDTSNKVFIREQRVRNSMQAEYVTDVVKNARIDLQNEFMEFMALINALTIVEGEEKYAELKLTINTMVREYVAKVRQRTKKKVVEE